LLIDCRDRTAIAGPPSSLKALRYGTGAHVPSITECAVSEAAAQAEVPTATAATVTLEDEGLANDGMHDLRGIAQSQAQAGVAASNHRPLIALDPYKTLGGHDQRKM
jgi:hypothetical protein